MFRNPFSFNGRIRRLEYGITFIIYIVLYVVILALMEGADATVLIGFILLIPTLWFLWGQGAKRCHDLNKSGWFQIIPFYFVVLIFQDGVPGMNEYGHNPKTHPNLSDVNPLDSETLDGHLRNPEQL
jgi:uncharacterized membrane protein YhaH (DUF805 family)